MLSTLSFVWPHCCFVVDLWQQFSCVTKFSGTKVCQGLKFIIGFQYNTRNVSIWIEGFKNERTSVKHEEAGRLSTSITDLMIHQAREMSLRSLWVNKMNKMACSHEWKCHILRELVWFSPYKVGSLLHFCKICVRCVPREIIEVHKRNSLEIC